MTDAVAVLQATPSVPSVPSGGGTSPFAILVALGIVVAIVQTQTRLDLAGLLSLGGDADGGSGASSASSGDSGGGFLSGLVSFVTSINGLAIGVLTLLSALIIGGAIDVPEGTGVPFVVALELTAAALVLDELGGLSLRLFGLVVAATALLGFSALGEPVVSAIVNSPTGPLAVIGGLYVLYTWATQDRSRTIVVRGEVQDADDGGDG